MHDAGITISNSDLKRLLACANADAALLYLYLAAGNDPAQAQTALRMSQSRVDLAAASLRQMGLTQDEPKHLAPAEAPSYTEQDVTREYRTNPEFPSMVGEAQRRLGRLLSTEEIKILLSIYRYLGLPPEVISILINYCIQRSRARGQTRMPSIRSIEKEAYRWADLGIDTMEEFIEYVTNNPTTASTAGVGSMWHIPAAQLAATLGCSDKVTFVPYDSGNKTALAVAQGEVDWSAIDAINAGEYMRQGLCKMLCVFSTESYEDKEFGTMPPITDYVPEMADLADIIGGWRGFAVSNETPDNIKAKLTEAFEYVINTDEFKELLANNNINFEDVAYGEDAQRIFEMSSRVSSYLLYDLGDGTRNPEDVEKLVRLMAFNVRLGNQDDHSKNFSFLLDAKGRWRLAPAYDLTPSRGVGGEQTCMVNGKGRDITDKDMIAAASVVDVPARTVKAILEQVGEAVAALPAILAEVSG